MCVETFVQRANCQQYDRLNSSLYSALFSNLNSVFYSDMRANMSRVHGRQHGRLPWPESHNCVKL